jgi:sarcosine oxidase delta subunit
MHDNRQGEQQEWWYHRSGCGLWFLARRDTKTNRVLETRRWRPAETSDSSTNAAW